MDHGFAPPFDLDSLRSKVEGRFDSVGESAAEGIGQGKCAISKYIIIM